MNIFSIEEQEAYIDGNKIDCVTRVQIDLYPNLNKSLVTLTTNAGIISENVDSKIMIDYDTSSFKQRRDWSCKMPTEQV